MAATSSLVVDVSNPQGINGTAIFEPQLGRAKVQGSGGPHTLLVYAIGNEIYQRFDGSAWQRRKLPAAVGSIFAPLGVAPAITPQADTRDASGMTYGALSAVTTLPIPGIGSIPNVQLECTYDKATMLLHVCTCQYATFTFHNYNDPKNAIDVPPEAKSAPESAPLGGAGFPPGK
jgi:hypothetical protein